MNKRTAVLAITAAVLVFTFALVAFSVYTVNTALAATTYVAPVDQPVTMTMLVTTDRETLTSLSTDNGSSVELAVQHIGAACRGDAADTPVY
jgi:hypothetical protein